VEIASAGHPRPDDQNSAVPSSVAPARWRAVAIDPVGLKFALVVDLGRGERRLIVAPGHIPPAIRTRPSASSVAVWFSRGALIEPVGLNLPVLGLEIGRGSTWSFLAADNQNPPVLEQRGRVGLTRLGHGPVGLKVPAAGSYTQPTRIEADPGGSVCPPTIDRPSRAVAVW